MATVSGRVSAVKLDVAGTKTVIKNISEFTLDINTDTEEQTFFGAAGFKRKVYLFSDWSGSISGKWDIDATAGKDGQKKIQDWILDPTTLPNGVRAEFYISDGTAVKVYYGYMMVKSQSNKAQATGSADVEFQFEGNGRVAYVTTAPQASDWTTLDNELA